MAWRINDDVIPLLRLEEAASRIYGYTLGLFVFQGVKQEGVFKGPGVSFAGGLDLL